MKSLDDMLAALTSPSGSTGVPDLIFLGEVHDDSVAHRLQLHVLEHCARVCVEQRRRLVLSLEMFETDVQQVLDEYVLLHAIREADLLNDARPWANYEQDYRPMVELCRQLGVRVVAANAPRRYVSLVSRHGSKALKLTLAAGNDGASASLPPLPLPPASAAYRQKFIDTIASQMPPAANSGGEGGECPFIGFRARDVRDVKPEMMEAQLLWDHAMAQSIAEASQLLPGESTPPLVVHVCGAFHCSYGLGIPEALPLYAAKFGSAAAPAALAVSQTSEEPFPWLPLDDLFAPGRGEAGASTDESTSPKSSPPGVCTVVLWPASVAGTKAAYSGGTPLPSLGIMGDWVIITEETWSVGTAPPSDAQAPSRRPPSGVH